MLPCCLKSGSRLRVYTPSPFLEDLGALRRLDAANELAGFRTRCSLSCQSDSAIAIDLMGLIHGNNLCQRWIRYLPDVPYEPGIEGLVIDPVLASITAVERNGRDIATELGYGCDVAAASNHVLP